MQQPIHSSRIVTAALIVAVSLLVCSAAILCDAAAQADGAALYKKHCTGCHPDGAKLKLTIPLLESLRTPPPGMPSYDKDKLTDADVRAIGEYLRPGSQPPAERKKEPERKAPAKADKPSKEKKSWMRGFGTSDL